MKSNHAVAVAEAKVVAAAEEKILRSERNQSMNRTMEMMLRTNRRKKTKG